MSLRLALCALFVATLLPGVATSQGVARPGVDGSPQELSCVEGQPCSTVLPGAVRFERPDKKPYAVGYAEDGTVVGWVVLSNHVVDIKGYSGKPLSTLVGLDAEGVITGGRVVHHTEPILLVGIPTQKLHDFVDEHAGVHVDEKVIVGGHGTEGRNVDIVSGATVTVLAESRTILDSARVLAQDVGILKMRPRVAGEFVTEPEPWTWQQILDKKAIGHLRVTHADMKIDGDEDFVDLYFAIADAPQVGEPLVGKYMWRKAMAKLQEGEHLVVVYGNGSNSFKGSGFVRGGIFDRVRIEQGLRSVHFRDLDYTALNQPEAVGAPHFKEGALFVAREGGLDPGEAFEFVFLGNTFDLKGGFSRDFHTFEATWRAPKSVYRLTGPNPDDAIWKAAWGAKPWTTAAVVLYLLAVIGVFAGRRWVTASMHRLERLHLGFLLTSFIVLGLGLSLQPSVTQLLTLAGAVVGEWRWGLFLSDPLLFTTWIFIGIVTVIWGRGVFCGWICPYGAISELLFKLGRKLKLPEYELPDPVHLKARFLRYVVFGVLLTAYLLDAETGERMAEVEPFKSTFFVAPWTRHFALFAYWSVLLIACFFWWRPFCRYICPLGAALAIPSSFRLSGPYRRDFCATGCKICPRGCEPKAIRKDGSIDARECLNCWECEANYHDDEVCPPLVQIRRKNLKAAKAPSVSAGGVALLALGLCSGAQAAEVLVTDDVQAAIDSAEVGDTVVLPEGVWAGPAVVNKAITLSSRGGVLDGGGEGTVLRIEAAGAVVDGLQITNSGNDRGGPDACVYIATGAEGVVVRDSLLRDCLFGVWVHEGRGVQILDNDIAGRVDIVSPSNRGNGVHLFDGRELVVRGNTVRRARDGVYVSATHNSLIEANVLEDLRYGIHYMYSFDNTVKANITRRNTSGIALMQSMRLIIEDNISSDNESHGILFRDVQYTRVAGNTVERNGEGLFFFSSLDDEIVNNRIAHNVIGARVWAGTERNIIKGNSFIGNQQQVFYVARDSQEWGDEEGGNYWSDHLGWDQDGDGVGDRPYRVDSLLSRLTYEYPAAVLLLHSPTLELITRLQARMPQLLVPTVIDRHPLMTPDGSP